MTGYQTKLAFGKINALYLRPHTCHQNRERRSHERYSQGLIRSIAFNDRIRNFTRRPRKDPTVWENHYPEITGPRHCLLPMAKNVAGPCAE
jgi:hypothetical protein